MTETPQPPVQAPQMPQQKQSNGLAVAGMVLGIIGLVGLCIWWLGLPCAIVGLILSILGKKKAEVTGTGAGMAKAGMICSIIAICLAVVGIILVFVGFSMFGSKIAEEMERQQQMREQSMLLIRSFLA